MPDEGSIDRSCIEFWFDFASGYAYFAALEIEELARRRKRMVRWRPFTMGAAFKVTGAVALSRTPLKCDYARLDWERLARRKGVAFNPPEDHPQTGLAAIRAFYLVEQIDASAAAVLAKALLVGYFQQRLNIDDPYSIAQLAGKCGVDPSAVLGRIDAPDVKALAREHGEIAVRRGIFGSPWIFVDGEPFWGSDRLPMVAQWLDDGPW